MQRIQFGEVFHRIFFEFNKILPLRIEFREFSSEHSTQRIESTIKFRKLFYISLVINTNGELKYY